MSGDRADSSESPRDSEPAGVDVRLRTLWLVCGLWAALGGRLWCAAPAPGERVRAPAPCRLVVQVGRAQDPVSCLDPGPVRAGWQRRWPPPCRPVPPLARLAPGDRVGVKGGRCTLSRMAPQLLESLGLPVALNRASPEELQILPGVGPALARRIVRERRARGPFNRPEDLLRVAGMGPRLLARIRGRLVL